MECWNFELRISDFGFRISKLFRKNEELKSLLFRFAKLGTEEFRNPKAEIRNSLNDVSERLLHTAEVERPSYKYE